MEKPDQPGEGQLIEAAIKRQEISLRKAASRVGLSDARLRQIIKGYASVGAGLHVPVSAPADTLARIASVFSISPQQLIQAGRQDAANKLIQRAAHSRVSIQENSNRARDELLEWLNNKNQKKSQPPAQALQLWSDEQLVQELMDRLYSRSENIDHLLLDEGRSMQQPGRWEVTYSQSKESQSWHHALSLSEGKRVVRGGDDQPSN